MTALNKFSWLSLLLLPFSIFAQEDMTAADRPTTIANQITAAPTLDGNVLDERIFELLIQKLLYIYR